MWHLIQHAFCEVSIIECYLCRLYFHGLCSCWIKLHTRNGCLFSFNPVLFYYLYSIYHRHSQMRSFSWAPCANIVHLRRPPSDNKSRLQELSSFYFYQLLEIESVLENLKLVSLIAFLQILRNKMRKILSREFWGQSAHTSSLTRVLYKRSFISIRQSVW